jgi:hypothetical protein
LKNRCPKGVVFKVRRALRAGLSAFRCGENGAADGRKRLHQRAVELRLEFGTISLPSGATMRLRPPRRWNRIGTRTMSVVPSSLLGALDHAAIRTDPAMPPGLNHFWKLTIRRSTADQPGGLPRPDRVDRRAGQAGWFLGTDHATRIARALRNLSSDSMRCPVMLDCWTTCGPACVP